MKYVDLDSESFEEAVEEYLEEKDPCLSYEEEAAGAEYPEDFEDEMDGDAQSALASCGFGTDEDYGDYGNDD